jgi:hypothetical protein
MVQESKYEALDRDITRAMLHAETVCLLKHNHYTPWSPAIGRATSSIRYWDLHIKRGGIREKIYYWTTTMNFLVLEQNLTSLLPSGNAYTKSTMHDQNSRMLLIMQWTYEHSLKLI